MAFMSIQTLSYTHGSHMNFSIGEIWSTLAVMLVIAASLMHNGDRLKSVQMLLRRTQAGPGRKVKQ